MAKDVKSEAASSGSGKKSSSKLLIILSILFVLILAIGGAGAYWLFASDNADDDEDVVETAKPAKKKAAKDAPPVYVALDAFVVNLVPEEGEQFLQLVISAEVEDIAVADRVKMYTPKIRNNIMLLLSGKKGSDLLTKEGKETLSGEIRTLMNEVLEPGHKGDDGPVKDVLFTSFIIQ